MKSRQMMQVLVLFVSVFLHCAYSIQKVEHIKVDANIKSGASPVVLGTDDFRVVVDTTTGVYTVADKDGDFLLDGGAAFHTNNNWYGAGVSASNITQKLILVSVNQANGSDKIGKYTKLDIKWLAGGNPIITSFQVYDQSVGSVAIFTQSFPEGLTNTGYDSTVDVISAFPTFGKIGRDFFVTWHDTFSYPRLGKVALAAPADLAWTGPIGLYTKSLTTTVISTFNNFMVSKNAFSPSLHNQFATGLQALIKEIPAGFSQQTIIVNGVGINDTFAVWGDIMRSYYGKERTKQDADIAIRSLGFWTDNGGYYWYNTEPNKNYEQTVADYRKYHVTTGIPYKYYQFDSWWYFKYNSSVYETALKLWEPRPDVFPDGFSHVAQSIDNLPLTLHNRHFSSTNDYVAMNFTFVIEEVLALPVDVNLYKYIMGKAKTWGLQVYEQDWMDVTYQHMQGTQNDVHNARKWLLAMGAAAAELGLTIQYCMDLPIMVLQSLEIPAVTQIRASTDYTNTIDQWKIGYTSLYIWSVGALPFKDDFWSSRDQPGCKFSNNCTEPNSEMQALISVLSTGPVGPSDGIGHSNLTLLLKTCNAEGLLLKPDKPATPIDAVFVLSILNSNVPERITGIEIWDTFTQFTDTRWHYIFAANLQQPFELHPSDIAIYSNNNNNNSNPYVIFNYAEVTAKYTDRSIKASALLHTFSPNSGYTIPAASNYVNYEKLPKSRAQAPPPPVSYSYLVASPATTVTESGSSNWIILGEIEKLVPVSHQRISNIITSNTKLQITYKTSPEEKVTWLFAYNTLSSPITYVACTTPQNINVGNVVCVDATQTCTCA